MNQPPLNPWSDWLSSFKYLLEEARSNPLVVAALMACLIVGHLFGFPLIFIFWFIDLCLVMWLASRIVHRVWVDTSRLPAPSSSGVDQVPLAQLVLTQFLYDIVIVVLSLALLVPGILWSIKWSLAIVFVVLEGQDAWKAVSSSSCLTKGRVWFCFKYLFVIPCICILLLAGLKHSLGDLAFGAVAIAVDFALIVVQLSMLPLQVKLYNHLRTPLHEPKFNNTISD